MGLTLNFNPHSCVFPDITKVISKLTFPSITERIQRDRNEDYWRALTSVIIKSYL